MIEKQLRDAITSLVKREVVPALGCTEPAAVSLCVAKATEMLGSVPERIFVKLSANMLKNAMGVGIPGTGMIGLPIAIALGALIGRAELGLEALRDVDAEAVKRGRQYISEERISIELDENAPSVLYIDVTVVNALDQARAVIAGSHTNFVYRSVNDNVLLDIRDSLKGGNASAGDTEDPELTLATVYEYAMESPLEEISFILESGKLNTAAAELALSKDYGHSLGQTIRNNGIRYFGDTVLERMISNTSAACDARMGGAQIAVMSNSGSGNQGITCTMPVVTFAREAGADEEHTVRALMLSHLTSIYIKQSLGKLSALCGCVVASTGASSGIVYLMGGGYDEICSAVKNMVANLTGMICDGAKPSCSMKISSGVSTALMSALLAMNGKCASSAEGIVCDDVDETIRNLTSIGRDAMRPTDKWVLHIMTHKC